MLWAIESPRFSVLQDYRKTLPIVFHVPSRVQYSLSTSAFGFCAERAEKLGYTVLLRASWGMMTSSLSFSPVVITALPNRVR